MTAPRLLISSRQDGDGFSGFPEAGIAFLEELSRNNNREWFEADRGRYGLDLRTPALALVTAGETYRLGDEQLKRVPRGYDADHPCAGWLKYKGLHVFAPPIWTWLMQHVEGAPQVGETG